MVSNNEIHIHNCNRLQRCIPAVLPNVLGIYFVLRIWDLLNKIRMGNIHQNGCKEILYQLTETVFDILCPSKVMWLGTWNFLPFPIFWWTVSARRKSIRQSREHELMHCEGERWHRSCRSCPDFRSTKLRDYCYRNSVRMCAICTQLPGDGRQYYRLHSLPCIALEDFGRRVIGGSSLFRKPRPLW